MSLARRPCSVLASAMLVAVALAAAPEALHARNAKGSAAQDWERRSAQAESAGHARAELDRRMDQSRSHPQSSDTMYASTPDPAPPPHPAHAGANTKSAPGRSGPPSGMPARSGAGQAHRIGLFPSAGDALGRQGFARIINHSESGGEVHIDAYDDEAERHGPLTLRIEAGETVHINSADLETGNSDKELDGATGSGDSDWRLELSTTLELEVLSYIRTEDGFLTSMHDFVPRTEAGHRVVTFNPGKQHRPRRVRLRAHQPRGARRRRCASKGVDGGGRLGEGRRWTLSLVPARAARTLDAAKELESGGSGLSGGALGDGHGEVAAGGEFGAGDRGDEPAVESDRASDQSVHGPPQHRDRRGRHYDHAPHRSVSVGR